MDTDQDIVMGLVGVLAPAATVSDPKSKLAVGDRANSVGALGDALCVGGVRVREFVAEPNW
jgi:hypothetical protein